MVHCFGIRILITPAIPIRPRKWLLKVVVLDIEASYIMFSVNSYVVLSYILPQGPPHYFNAKGPLEFCPGGGPADNVLF